ncbi:MAG: FlgD immunoglobulin-like domain containing protein [Enterobacteriaceae bacterium]
MNVDRPQPRTNSAPENDQSSKGTPPSNNNQGKDNGNLGNMFMNLLVAQIQNQNPLDPMDSSQFVNQLSQLTQMQYTELMTKQLMQNNIMMDNLQVMATGNLVGQTVFVETDKLELNGQPVNGRINLPHAANSVTLVLKDEAGTEHKIDLGQRDKGNVDFSFDPKDSDLSLPDGKYTVKVVVDGEDSDTTIPVEIVGSINSVRLPREGEEGGIKLFIPGIGEVPYGKISQFGNPSGNKPEPEPKPKPQAQRQVA